MPEAFITYLKEQGWTVELKERREAHLPKAIEERYTNIPQQWLDFICAVKSITNSDETTWFLCADDYNVQEENAFQWNEWELVSLESAENDTEWKDEIKKFWNNHLPVIMSVKGGYSYFAISLENGSVVRGAEPEFEKCETVADSFREFMEKIVRREIII